MRRRVTAGHLDSDAALLWCRTRAAQPDPHIAIVDGSFYTPPTAAT